MSKRIPPFIAEMYGSSHNFRKSKRDLVKHLLALTDELRRGCAFFPMGSGPVDRIQTDLMLLKERLSTRRWGK